MSETSGIEGERTGLLPPEAARGEELVLRVRRQLARLFGRLATDAATAEDLAQEALARVLRGLPRFAGAAAPTTWARRIALNVWRDHLRGKAATPPSVSLDALLDTFEPPTPALSSEERSDRSLARECLLAAVDRLPDASRRALVLHDLGELSPAETGAALGCSPGAAKVRAHRARRLLATTCRADCVAEPGADGVPLCRPKIPRASRERRVR